MRFSFRPVFVAFLCGAILTSSRLKADVFRVYFVTGDRREEPGSWPGKPFRGRCAPLLVRLAWQQFLMNLGYSSGHSPEYFAKNDLLTAVSENWRYFRSIRPQIKLLQRKGYEVSFIPEIEAKTLFQIVGDSHTLAVFHSGHGYTSEDFSPRNLILTGELHGDVYLGVMHKGQESAITDEVVNEIRGEGIDIPRSNNIQLFFTTACYAGYCEQSIRHRLGLPESTRFLSTRDIRGLPAEHSYYEDEIRTFEKEVYHWVLSLPPRN